MESAEIFHNFKLAELSEDWVKSVWLSNFMILQEPPDEYLMFLESEDMRLLLHETCSTAKTWISQIEDPNSNNVPISWHMLMVCEIKIQALLAVIGFIMKNGQKNESGEASREACLYATSLYFILLAIPGSNIFNVFNPNLYAIAIDTFNFSEQLLYPCKKHSRVSDPESLNIAEGSRASITLVQKERENLLIDLTVTVYDFILMLKTFRLKHHTSSLEVSIQGLLKLTRIQQQDISKISSLSSRKSDSCILLPDSAFIALEELCHSNHGPIDKVIMVLVKLMFPHLLCNLTQNQVKYAVNNHESYIYFLQRILDTHKEEAESAFVILAQQLLVVCPEKSEARQKQAAVLMKFLSICKQNIIEETCKHLLFMSHDSKVLNRIFAQEILGRILTESCLKHCIDLHNDNTRTKINRTFFAAVLSRFIDCSSLVRGKALSIAAEYVDAITVEGIVLLGDIFHEENPNKPLPTLEELQDALVSGTKVLPGSNTFINVLMHRVNDKRAHVRRNALIILENLVKVSPGFMKEAMPILSRRCRDPAIIVRRQAVQVFSQLLEDFPNNFQLLHEWVESVVPQVFDIEPRVQEKVLQHLEKLLLSKIRKFDGYDESDKQSLPWKILNRLCIARMSKDLAKACSFWVKNGLVTKTLVENVQSHVGTVNDTAAWTLLSALAESTSLPYIEKHISNYKVLLERNDFHASLVLQVLRKSWKSLDADALQRLCDYLLKHLGEFRVDVRLIGACLDILNEVLVYLHPKDGRMLMEERASSLVKLSEEEIEKILKKENILFEEAPNYLKAMFTLGHSSLFSGCKVSPLILRILQGMLLEKITLPKTFEEIEELRVFAVVILGQQAVRDREVAQNVVPLLGKLLRQETSISSPKKVAVKINSAKALADICMRFTALVDPYLPDMCVTMKDENSQVRKTIIIIFIQLLLEDFVKVKGPFFFHVLTMLCDSDNTIRELTVFLIEERLLVKNKSLISQQFLEGIYHYNDYQSQYKHSDQRLKKKGREILTFAGRRNEDKRRLIYDFMLEHLDPPGKLKLLVKLTSQILAGACTGSVNMKREEGACVLKDALYVILNERMQLSSGAKEGEESYEQDESAGQSKEPSHSAIKILIEGMKRHGVDVLLPVLIRLKQKTASIKSSLENDVKALLVKTYLNYNTDELSHVLTEYPQLVEQVLAYQRQTGSQKQKSQNDTEDTEEPEEVVDPPSAQSNRSVILSPRVVLERLTPVQLLKYTKSRATSPVTKFSSSSCFRISSDSIQSNLSSVQLTNTSTPKSGRWSSTECEYNSSTRSKRRKLSGYRWGAPKRRIVQVDYDDETDLGM